MTDTPVVRSKHTAVLRSGSAADDAAFIALHDLSLVLADHPGSRVVGGHMVALFAAALPARGLVNRRTNDADAGITVDLAASADLHSAFEAAGYERVAGNTYEKQSATGEPPHPSIDLLVPAYSALFKPVRVEGFEFDSSPGLGLVVDNEQGVDIEARTTLRDGTVLLSAVTIPTLEAAFILKAYAWKNRHAQVPKDSIDIMNLLAVLDRHGAENAGGWRLATPQTGGTRKDAQVIAGEMARWADGRGISARTGVDPRLFAVLLRKHVATPA